MSRTTERLEKVVRRAASRAGDAVTTVQKRVKKELRKRRVKRVVREAGEAAAMAGAAALASAAVFGAGQAIGRRVARRHSRLGSDLVLSLGLEEAIGRVTDVLRGEGFGILTRIDVHKTLREKLGVDFRPYVILGACNPPLAHRALSAKAMAGLLLPCNVTVEESSGGGTVVRIADPETMLRVGGLQRDEEFRAIAGEARARLQRAAAALTAGPVAVS